MLPHTLKMWVREADMYAHILNEHQSVVYSTLNTINDYL